jgi:hypothetical protein
MTTTMTPDYQWTNWNRNLQCVANLYQPRSLDELCENVRTAAKSGRVRPIGNSCSWSPLIPTSGSLIDLSKLTRVISLNETDPIPSVTVECGVPMRELVAFTKTHELSIITPTIFQGVAMGGAIAVAAHGTGLSASTISDEVMALTLVDADGTPRYLEPHHGAIFDAARCALGTLGAIYSAKLRVHRAFNVHVEDRFIPRNEVLNGLKDILRTYEFVELYWFPGSDVMWCKLMNRTSQIADLTSINAIEESAFDYVATMVSGQVLIPFIARYAAWLSPLMMKVAPSFAVRPGIQVLPSSVEFHYQQAYPRNWDMSWGVPLDRSEDAWRASIDLVMSYASRGKYPINMVIHSRFIGKSSTMLSPACDGPICDIEAVTCTGTPDIEPFYMDFTDAMLAFPNARPHWGKYILRPKEIKARYPKMNEFLQLREQLDPNRVFLNDFLQKEVFQL